MNVLDNPWGLNEKQVRTLEAYSQTGTSKGAAAKLRIHKSTVEMHLAVIRQLIGTHTVGCCVVWAKWSVADE